MVKIFIIYGGREGEGIGTIIRGYFRTNNIESFLASRDSPDVKPGQDFQRIIDENLVNADIVIIVITPELERSPAAMSEIVQVQTQLQIPFIPYQRRESPIPEILSHTQIVEFDSTNLHDNALRDLEITMWRTLDAARISLSQIPETETEVPYIG